MTYLKIVLFHLLCFQMTIGNTAEAYKWTDENGDIHYSSSPPLDKKTKSLGISINKPDAQSTPPVKNTRCAKASNNELIIGEWLSKTDITVSMRFYKRTIQGHKTRRYVQKYNIIVNRRSIQSGLWKLHGDVLKLSIINKGRKRTRFKIVTSAKLVFVTTKTLSLIINQNKKIKLNRYTSSGDMPNCMRRKRRR